MKISDIKQRLKKDRPFVSVTLRMPRDVVADLKRLSPLLGFTGYQPLLRYYVGRGLREELERLEKPRVDSLVESLKRHGVRVSTIHEALNEIQQA